MDKSYKRKGNYYNRGGGSFNNWNNSKKKFRNYLAPGMKGFLCTCNFREKDCVKESYNILNEYADEIFGSDEVGRQAVFSSNWGRVTYSKYDNFPVNVLIAYSMSIVSRGRLSHHFKYRLG